MNNKSEEIKIGNKNHKRPTNSDGIKGIMQELQNILKPEYPYLNLDAEDMEGEDWNEIPWLNDFKEQYTRPNNQYKKISEARVSNMGRVKFKFDNENEYKIIPQNDDIEKGYLRLANYPGFGEVYRLVAEIWIGEIPPRAIVHHIDNDGYNNRVENLLIVTPDEHWEIHHPKENP